jgi:ELWxxDGT repeat protein
VTLTIQQPYQWVGRRWARLAIGAAMIGTISGAASAQVVGPQLVKNIYEDAVGSDPHLLVDFNGTLFFVARERNSGVELWRSDGTEAGTVLVKDIYPNAVSSGPLELTVFKNALYFSAAGEQTNGRRELWKSDGTTAGTVLFKDINGNQLGSRPDQLVVAGDTLYFVTSGAVAQQLWRSDGTVDGTTLVQDFGPGNFNIYELTAVGNLVYFRARSSAPNQWSLWRSDGTSFGTILLHTFPEIAGNLEPKMLGLNGTLFFAGTTPEAGTELWKSDGTAIGTVIVKDINPDTFGGAGIGSTPSMFFNFNGTLLFSAVGSGMSGHGVWKSDGTEFGTTLVADVDTGPVDPSLERKFVQVNNTVFFYTGGGLWKTDGTLLGSVLVKNVILPLGAEGESVMEAANGLLYFAAEDSNTSLYGQEMWRSDGTDTGTFRISDIWPGGADGIPRALTLSGRSLFFRAEDGVYGPELYRFYFPGGLDTDTDGLDNEWEIRFGLDPSSSIGDNGADGDPDHDGLTNAQELAAGTHPRGLYKRYLAEGALNSFFDLRLALLNVGNDTTTLQLQLLQPGGATVSIVEQLAPGRRRTLTRPDFAALTSSEFATVLESDQPVVLDRTMSWDANSYGSHAETGVLTPSTTWYLAEGSTSGDFSLFYLLQNPNAQSVTATIRYLRPFGLPPLTTSLELGPLSRTTIPVDAQGPDLASTDVSGVITTTAPIVVERAMYRSTPTQAFAAGHDSAGVTAPSTHWFLAEGATGPFFDCFILLANPNPQAATVSIEYLLLDGTTQTKTYGVPGDGRVTIYVDEEEIPAGSGIKPLVNVAVSSSVTSDVPIIVERTMWWPSPATTPNYWTEAHNSPGTTSTGTKWALAEGEVGGPQGADTFVLVANTSPFAGAAHVTVYFEDGTSSTRQILMSAKSRTTVNMAVDFPEAAGKRFGTVIESIGTTPAEIVVERAMYTSPGGVTWAAGTNALATRLP